MFPPSNVMSRVGRDGFAGDLANKCHPNYSIERWRTGIEY
jgi:hypothetical protein